jgi:colanic acid/amylovoran biosynthesis glycosyltransferase
MPEGSHVACTPEQCVGYVLRCFPELSQTFVASEIAGLRKSGLRVQVFSLLNPNKQIIGEQSRAIMTQDAHYAPFLSALLVRELLSEMRNSPVLFRSALQALLAQRQGGSRLFARAAILFPKAIHFGRLARQLGVTHLHAHWAGISTAMAEIMSITRGVPFSFSVYTMPEIEGTPILPRQVERAVAVRVCSVANLRCLSTRTPRFESKIHVVRAVDTVGVPSLASMNIPLNAVSYFAAIGRLVPMKGFDDLIRACGILRREGMRFKAMLVGDGEERDRLTSLVQTEGLGDEIEFLGAQPHERAMEILRGASFLVAPSVRAAAPHGGFREDGLPTVILEAMAFGKPAISTDVGGITEVVLHEQTGILVPTHDPVRLAAAIRSLIEHPDRVRQMGVAARELIRREYSEERTIGALRDLFGGANSSRSSDDMAIQSLTA